MTLKSFSTWRGSIKSGRNRSSAISAIRQVPKQHWQKEQVRPLVDNLVAYVSDIPASGRTGPSALEAIALAKDLATLLPADQASAAQQRLDNLDVQVVAIGTLPERMLYDKERIAIQAGKPVEFRFSNSDAMPHNFAITVPGAMEEIGLLAEATARDADAMQRHYIPKSDKILLASRLLQPGQSQSLAFDAPQQPGVYPYVCTFPGHWRRMYGALYVVENLEAVQGRSGRVSGRPRTAREGRIARAGRPKPRLEDRRVARFGQDAGSRPFVRGGPKRVQGRQLRRLPPHRRAGAAVRPGTDQTRAAKAKPRAHPPLGDYAVGKDRREIPVVRPRTRQRPGGHRHARSRKRPTR